ncbi:MAG: hypothetical protein NE328_01310 [Lentisphaeraceae bacterium]|nr:hypothetical protein [Lentisphaeraceae bacterium]
MKKPIILLSVLLLASCANMFKVVPSKWTGKDAYTQHGFHYEKNRHMTTNYIRGSYVPPGTKVNVLSVTSKVANLQIDGNTIEIVNIEKYTNTNIEGVLDRLLTDKSFTPTVSEQFKVNLKTGQPSIGMTKDEVITCIGYPPAHSTYELSAQVWKYWYSRFDTKDLIFVGDKLNSIRN